MTVHRLWLGTSGGLVLVSAVSLAIGWIVGQPAMCLVAGLFLFAFAQVRLLAWIERWVESGFQREPDSAFGLGSILAARVRRAFRKFRSREHQLELLVGRFREAADAVPEGLVALDEHGRILWCNAGAEQLLELQASDIGQPLGNIVRDPDLLAYVRAGDLSNPLVVSQPGHGQPLLSIRIVPYGAGQQLLIAEDVTRLQRLEHTRRQFVSNVSHELRTPLTVLTGYLETMSESSAMARGRWAKPIRQMIAQTSRMQEIVKDLLLLSRLETDAPADLDQVVAVPGMLAAIREDANALSGEKQHHIELDSDNQLWLSGSESELRSAFSNIVFNAVRYTPAGGRIRLRWAASEHGAQFSVEDDGAGIPRSHLDRLTERFYRVDSGRSRQAGGTGLGLAIVKHVLIRHGGRLEIRSEQGRGSTFVCHFSADRIVHPARVRGPAPPAATTG